jgi:hypothetical protein
VGGALIQKNCVYFVLKYGNNKEGNRKEHVLRSKSRVVYSGFADYILNDLPPLTLGEGERGGEAGKSK